MQEEIFHSLGLSYYESKALAELLKKELTLKELSAQTKIPFGKIYSITSELAKKGLIRLSNTRPKKAFIQHPSEIINNLIEKKEGAFQATARQARELAIECDKEKASPSRFFEIGATNEDNKRIQLRSFTEAKKEVCQILNIHHKPRSNRKNKGVWEDAIKEAAKRGVIFKAIYPEKADIPLAIKKLSSAHPTKFQIRRLDTDFVRCDIIDRKKVLIKIVHADPLQFGGVLFIEDEKLAQNLLAIFDQFWDTAFSYRNLNKQ